MSSLLEQYRITDFLDWYIEKRLELNPDFQRGSVWTPAARTFLIDTILRQLPIPKVYLRTRIDVGTQKSIREVVDGQQRLRAILDFAQDKFVLSARAGEYAGKRYSSLSVEDQERFLGYPIAVDQLLNASVDDVLEVFARLNSYGVTLNPPEKRHARFQGEFKWAVRNTSRRNAAFWEVNKVLSVRERVRMLDDSLTAEMFGVILEGLKDGGQVKIDALYRRHDPSFPADSPVPERVTNVLEFINSSFGSRLRESFLFRPPHLLMLFAAVAHMLFGIPAGEIAEAMPARPSVHSDLNLAADNLLFLAHLIEEEDEPEKFADFWNASTASTQRIASRKVRFPLFVKALCGEQLQ